MCYNKRCEGSGRPDHSPGLQEVIFWRQNLGNFKMYFIVKTEINSTISLLIAKSCSLNRKSLPAFAFPKFTF